VLAPHSPAGPSLRRYSGQSQPYAESLRTTMLKHPGLLPVIARPAVTPATLDAVEEMLRVLTSAGFSLARALDTLNTLTVFGIGHASAEAAIGSPGPPAGLAPKGIRCWSPRLPKAPARTIKSVSGTR
jgi:tetracycline repressor-like protein